MTAQKFVKRPDVFEAMQFTGENATAIVQWATGRANGWGGDDPFEPNPGWWIKQRIKVGDHVPLRPGDAGNFNWYLVLPHVDPDEVRQEAAVGDWIVRVPNPQRRLGTLTVMKPEAFAKAYAPVEDE